HELNEDDFDRRVQFSEVMIQRIDHKPNFLHNIVFSDETSFEITGKVNRHNFRYWDNENLYWMLEAHTQRPQKLNVWAGLYDNQVVG
ncbi:hypothetical protein EAI_05004, partial [Harpegnathos saltator]